MRFLNFNSVDRLGREHEKTFPGPGLGSLPHEEGAALPEEDRWSGPHNDLPGGDSRRGPGHSVKDVSDLQKGTGTVGPSRFTSLKSYIPPRAVPR